MTDLSTPPMVISRGGFAALMRVLLEQDDLMMTDIQSQPVAVGRPSANRFYRLNLSAEGKAGPAALTVILKVLPEATMMEAWNPRLDGPAELVALDSDLLTSFPQGITDPTIASARAREGKPAWTMSSDVVADLGQGKLSVAPDPEALRLILYRLAELHTLYWDGLELLDFLYPWITRQSEWLQQAAAVYRGALVDAIPDTAAGRLLQADQPAAGASLRALFAALNDEDADTLRELLAAPETFIERLGAAPPTVSHGMASAGNMALADDKLVLVEWEWLQVAPSSWDVWMFWSSLLDPPLTEDAALGFYLDALESMVGPIDRETWMDTYTLAPVVSFLLYDLAQAARATPDAPPSPGLVARAAQAAKVVRQTGV